MSSFPSFLTIYRWDDQKPEGDPSEVTHSRSYSVALVYVVFKPSLIQIIVAASHCQRRADNLRFVLLLAVAGMWE